MLDPGEFYRARSTRDARYDGRFFVGNLSSGIYCRPTCPSRTPRSELCRFHRSSAAASAAGLRPCLRCRPELSPRIEPWRGAAPALSRALALIDEAPQRAGCTAALAERACVGEAELERLFETHLGASPGDVALARRLQLAKMLITDTSMALDGVAEAAGYVGARRLDDALRAAWGRSARELRARGRRQDGTRGHGHDRPRDGVDVTLRLGYAPPYDWPAVLEFLAARAIPGVERIERDCYRRSVAVDGGQGFIEVRSPRGARASLMARIVLPRPAARAGVLARIERVFDLGADVAASNAHLERDELLAPLVASRPGLRVAGGWSEFELAVRAVLGQQITVAGARKLGGDLVAAFGRPLDAATVAAAGGALTHAFPEPADLATADVGAALAMPRMRASAIAGIARALAGGRALGHGAADVDEEVTRLRQLPGIGEWSAHYIAMRALKLSDAFPAGDAVLLRALARLTGRRPTPTQLVARAERWRPWRAYAATQLWATEARAREQRLTAARARARRSGD